MKTMTITIDTGNDAFKGSRSAEIARILRDYADRLVQWGNIENTQLYDINGNNVGEVVFAAECQCGSCEQIFKKRELVDGKCPHCGSGNWVNGMIDS
jgi:DNA polymerase II large subunit